MLQRNVSSQDLIRTIVHNFDLGGALQKVLDLFNGTRKLVGVLGGVLYDSVHNCFICLSIC
jgi:hypothetical protein